MRLLNKFLIVLCSLLVLTSCTKPEPEIITKTEYVDKEIPAVARPTPVSLTTPKFYVVTQDNYTAFIQEFNKVNGTDVFVALSVKDYENLSINITELKRYIEQQKQIIVYYEQQVKE